MARLVSLCIATFAVLGISGSAEAEIYRCVARDGTVTYTSSESACPGAKPHKLRGRIERVNKAPPPARAVRRPQPAPEAGQAAQWRAKKAAAKQQLDVTTQRSEQFRHFVTWCNRGGDLYQTDRSGLRRQYSCEDADREWENAKRQRDAAAQYLAEGLEEECRRSGCLPGWIR